MQKSNCLFGRPIKTRRAFTLVELLVVIGLIAVLAAGIGVSMRDGNPSGALRGAQGTLVGMLSGARGQAALTQSEAMLVIDVTDPLQDEFLRALQLVVRAHPTNDQWRAVGTPVLLPKGIYVVPPTGVTLTGVTMTGSWSPTRRSRGFQSPPSGPLAERSYSASEYPYHETNTFNGRTYLKFQSFSPLGTTAAAGTILLTAGKRTGAAAITLDNPELLRGVFVSRYGVPTIINEAATFDQLNP